MGLLLKLKRILFGPSESEVMAARQRAYLASKRCSEIKAKYDSAQRTLANADYWKLADGLSAREANSLDVRRRLRERSRYLCSNTCHARGITLATANDMIGTGPRLQIMFDDEGLCDAIETAWNEWATAVNWAQKLHIFHLGSEVSGESFALLGTNPNLPTSVQLDIMLRECDMVTTPDTMAVQSQNYVDGIELDKFGTPTAYHLLRQHPGDAPGFAKAQADRIPARNMLHWFREDREQQYRGIPSLTPAMSILVQLGRYSLATLMAAEIAADFSLFIYTDQRPSEISEDEEQELSVKPWSTTPVVKGTIQALPDSWKVDQLTPTQPITGYAEYTKALLREACHALLIPYNVANADFEGDSYAGGRMSLQVYQRQIKVRRAHFKSRVLDRAFAAWLDEAVMVPGLLPKNTPATVARIPHAWHYDAWGHVDPTKEAKAATECLSNFTTTLATECAEAGSDWRKIIQQRAKEIALQKKLGVLILPPGTPPLSDSPDNSDATEEEIAQEVADAA